MVNRKKIKSSRYLAAFAITILIFLLGFMLSSELNSKKLKEVDYLSQDIRVESLSNELVLQLIQKDLCDGINTQSYAQELSTIGTRLAYLESLFGYSAPEVVHLKNYYSLLEIRHWMISEEMNKKCDYDKPLILYFYTNDGCVDCEDQGLVLTNIHREYPVFNVYSFEYDLNNTAVNYLLLKYDVSKDRLPAMVIDDKPYYGFQSKELLVELLDLERRLAEDKLKHPEAYK